MVRRYKETDFYYIKPVSKHILLKSIVDKFLQLFGIHFWKRKKIAWKFCAIIEYGCD